MKKFFITAAVLFTLSFAAKADVNEKVLKVFSETFQNAREVKWHEYDQTYQVNFKQDGIATTVLYDHEGKMLEARRHSKEDILPLIIKEKLKRKYTDQTVFGVTEVATEQTTIYRIVLEDAKHWYVIETDANGAVYKKDKFFKA